jgi:hypothetical protein
MVGNQRPLKGPSELMLYNNFCLGLHANLLEDSSLYNYADDNALSVCSPDFDLLISTLESDSNHLIEWFKINKMCSAVGMPSCRLYLYVCQNLLDNQSQCLVI